MSDPVRPAALLPGDVPSRWRVWRSWLLRTFPGTRARARRSSSRPSPGRSTSSRTLPPALDAIDMVGSLALLFAIAYGLTRFAVWSKRRLLWRVRRKLILSYVFVGVVPALLVITFFLLAGLILAFNVSSYLVQSRIRNLTDQARFLAQTVQLEVQRSTSAEALAGNARAAPVEHRDALSVRVDRGRAGVEPVVQGRSRRRPRACRRRCRQRCRSRPAAGDTCPRRPTLPKWVGCDGFSGLIAYNAPSKPGAPPGEPEQTRLVMRAVALAGGAEPGVGRDPRHAAVDDDRAAHPAGNRHPHGRDHASSWPAACSRWSGMPSKSVPSEDDDGPVLSLRQARWVVFLDHVDWATGEPESASAAIVINTFEVFDRISVVSPVGLGQMNFGQVLLFVLALVGVLFMIIQFVALVIGFVLARQITGAVHDLFTGTQHVRAGDFGAPDSGARARSAGRARRIVQPDDRRSDDAARRDGGEGPPRAGDVRRARDPAEAAADRAAARDRPGRLGILRTGARSGGRLLRLPADHRFDPRRADRRRRRQGPRRRPVHGAAEGDRPVAVAAASRAEGIPDGGQQGRLREPRRQELHHDDRTA